MKSKKGFTLVELMIVMVIIGILLSLLLPGVFTAREEALKTQTASNLRQIGIALYAHAKNNAGILPANVAELVTDGYLTDDSVFENAFGGDMELEAAVMSKSLYAMDSTDVLITDDEIVTEKATGYELRADGSVNTAP
ncbi:MAG: prepilin-type N-terminal cleavage/methylation domain-containing protein [Candidatus Kappaea frigidicola]|nr:prepilin-type N-terminal cleavage/methylation domain-containing protein [Candidatus Kappaea frigidicola]